MLQKKPIISRLFREFMRGKNNSEGFEFKAQQIMLELEQCREDAREANTRILYSIVAATGLFAAIFAFLGTKDLGTIGKNNIVFPLGIAVLSAASGYIATVGIFSTIRHYYMLYLEQKLYDLSDEKVPHWISISRTVNTLNASHIKTPLASLHYANILSAMLSAVVAFFMLAAIFINFISYEIIIATILIWLPSFILVVFSFLYCTRSNISNKNFDELISESNANRSADTSKSKKRHVISKLFYFILPRPTDLQKSLFVIFGALVGSFLGSPNVSFLDFNLYSELFTSIGFAIIVNELLAYQVRYQLNDIRGIDEDDYKRRLPHELLGKQVSLAISVIVGVYKILVAFYIICLAPVRIRLPLSVILIAIFVLAGFYEISRKRKSTFWVLFLVPFGYLIRFISGMWVARPDLLSLFAHFNVSNKLCISIVLIILSILFFGEVFDSLAWVLEAAHIKRESKVNEQSRKPPPPMKNHFKFLLNQLVNWQNEFPLKRKGKLLTIWNIFILLSVSSLQTALVLLSNNLVISIIVASVTLFTVILALVFPQKKILLILGALSIFQIFQNPSALWIVMCVASFAYSLVYIMFRNMNFKMMENVFQNILHSVKKIVWSLLIIIIGDSAAKYFRKPDRK